LFLIIFYEHNQLMEVWRVTHLSLVFLTHDSWSASDWQTKDERTWHALVIQSFEQDCAIVLESRPLYLGSVVSHLQDWIVLNLKLVSCTLMNWVTFILQSSSFFAHFSLATWSQYELKTCSGSFFVFWVVF